MWSVIFVTVLCVNVISYLNTHQAVTAVMITSYYNYLVAFFIGGRRCNDRPTARVLKIMLPKSLDCDSAKQA